MTTPADWWIALGSAIGVGFASGAAPIALAEATAMGAAAIPDVSLRCAVILAFTTAHLAGKALWYWVGTLEGHVTRPSLRRWLDRARTVAESHATLGAGLTASSALVSMPPFQLMTIAAGIVRAPAARFFIVAFVGRLIRFGVLAAFPSAIHYLFVGR